MNLTIAMAFGVYLLYDMMENDPDIEKAGFNPRDAKYSVMKAIVENEGFSV